MTQAQVQNVKPGDSFQHKHTIGIEFETLVIESSSDLQNCIDTGLLSEHNDGSIEPSPDKGGDPIELVTRILQPHEVEEKITAIGKAFSSSEMYANRSCGLHVHVGVNMASQVPYDVTTVGYVTTSSEIEAISERVLDGVKGGVYVVLPDTQRIGAGKSNVYKLIANYQRIFSAKIGKSFFFFSGQCDSSLVSAISEVTDKRAYGENDSYIDIVALPRKNVSFSRHCVFRVDTSDYSVPVVNEMCDFLKTYEQNGGFKELNMEAAVEFLSVVEPVIRSMLPLSRRYNTYCLPLVSAHRPYTNSGRSSITSGLTRYTGFNLCSFSEHGTIEVRYHEGTVNAEKIRHWVRLCTALIHKAVTYDPSQFNSEVAPFASEPSIKKSREMLFELLDLPMDTRDHLNERAARYYNAGKGHIKYIERKKAENQMEAIRLLQNKTKKI